MEKIFEQQADSHYLALIQCGSDFTERQVGRDQRHSKLSTREQHREILHTATVGKKLGLPRKPETDLVHSRFMDRPRHYGLNFAAERESGAFFQGVECSMSRLLRRLA